MRVLFMGSPGFAVPVVDALVQAGHQVVGAVTRPDRPSGRGRQLAETPVRSWAGAHGVPVLQPRSLRPAEALSRLAALSPEAIVVAAYGRILPPPVLDLPRLGCLNLHPSLLPRHRGPSPVVDTLLQGDAVAGVTVMLMDEGMDSGPVLAQEEEPVAPEDTTESLTWRLFQRGAGLMARTLDGWARGEVRPIPQDDALATYSSLIRKEDGELDFALAAARLEAQVRAYQPWPGTNTRWRGRSLKVLAASVLPAAAVEGAAAGPPGLVVRTAAGSAAPVAVATGDGLLGLRRLQPEGRHPVAVEEFLRGHPSFVGATLPGP